MNKQFTLKHIVLALALTGYTAGSAMALEMTSSLGIKGRAPILVSILASPEDHTLTVTTEKGTGGEHTAGDSLGVGDKIIFKYKVADLDKDPEGTSGSLSTIELRTKTLTTNSWNATNPKALPADFVDGGVDASGIRTLTFTVPPNFIDVTAIGLLIHEKTQYGFPNTNQWLSVTDIFTTGTPSIGTNPPTDPGIGPSGPGDVGSPIVVTPTKPVVPGLLKIGIFEKASGSVNYAVNYGNTTTDYLMVGKEYQVGVWLDKDENGKLNGTETDIASDYSWAWQLAGSNTDAGGSSNLAAAGVDIANPGVVSYTILDNVATKAIAGLTAAEAGAQGFKLKVKSL